jgi:aminodeoxyfutalosine deaminase
MPVTNAHTHLELTNLSFLYSEGPRTLRPWMKQVYRHMNQQTDEQVFGAVRAGIEALQSVGTTHVVDISGRWLSIELLRESGLQGIVCLEVFGLERQRALERLEEAKRIIDRERSRSRSSAMRVGLSLHAPYSCHPVLLEQGGAWCAAENVPLCIHVGESPGEQRWIQQARMTAVMGGKPVSRRIAAAASRFLPGKKPISYLDSLGVLSASLRVDVRLSTVLAQMNAFHAAGCPLSDSSLRASRYIWERTVLPVVPTWM